MAHSKQAKKRLRQAEKRRIRNKGVRTRMNTEVKKTLAAFEDGDVAKAKEQIREAIRRIDKAAKKNVIHRNTAARRKSLLARRLNKLEAGAKA